MFFFMSKTHTNIEKYVDNFKYHKLISISTNVLMHIRKATVRFRPRLTVTKFV